jgi:hypothetical protein
MEQADKKANGKIFQKLFLREFIRFFGRNRMLRNLCATIFIRAEFAREHFVICPQLAFFMLAHSLR